MSAPDFDASTRMRLAAWERIAEHPFFADCYRGDETLLDAMVAKLDELPERDRMLESAVRAQVAADLGGPFDGTEGLDTFTLAWAIARIEKGGAS